MQDADRRFNAMSAQEKCDVIINAAAELVYQFYYDQDREGLNIMKRNFGSMSGLIQNCEDCLTFLQREGEVFAKIYLLLDFLGRDGLDENFVEQLEKLAERARTCLEEGDITPADEVKCLRNIRIAMRQNELEAELASLQEV